MKLITNLENRDVKTQNRVFAVLMIAGFIAFAIAHFAFGLQISTK